METVKCKSCGAVQEVSNEASKCEYCSSPIELQQSKEFYKETISGEAGNLMAMADTAIDATNWEEALQFYNKVLEKDITNADAWLGKGIAIVYTSKIGELKTTEAIAYWKNAIKHSSNKEAMGKRVAKEINKVVNTFYPNLENHFIQFKDLNNSYVELVDKFAILEKAQDYATQLDVDNIEIYQTGYELCKKVIQLPKSYAIADEMGAWVTGIAGALTQNKYQTQDASRQRNDAKKRQEEIKKASVIVALLEDKYLKNIRRLGGDSTATNFITKENEDEILRLYFQKGQIGRPKAMMLYHKITGFSLEQSKKDVDDLANKKGPSSETEANVEPRNPIMGLSPEEKNKAANPGCLGFVIGVFLGVIVGGVIGIYLLNPNGIEMGDKKPIYFSIFGLIGGGIGFRLFNKKNDSK
jgi:hypothetical protein